MAMDDFDLAGVSQIRLLEDKDDVLEPFLLDEIQKVPGGLRPGIYDRKNEENDVCARDETFGNALVFRNHRVGPRCVHDVEVVQERNWEIALGQLLRNFHRFILCAVPKNIDSVGGWPDIHLREFLAEKRVEKGGFAGLNLADDHKKQRLVDIQQQPVERLQRGLVASHFDA